LLVFGNKYAAAAAAADDDDDVDAAEFIVD